MYNIYIFAMGNFLFFLEAVIMLRVKKWVGIKTKDLHTKKKQHKDWNERDFQIVKREREIFDSLILLYFFGCVVLFADSM